MRMKTLATLLLVTCAAVVTSVGLGFAAQAAPKKATEAATARPIPVKCKAMMAAHEKQMAGVKAADARQDALVVKMNAASGHDKAAAIAAVVTDIVASRRGMQGGMMTMQHEMMGHMAEHMQAGKESMDSCPMMNKKKIV